MYPSTSTGFQYIAASRRPPAVWGMKSRRSKEWRTAGPCIRCKKSFWKPLDSNAVSVPPGMIMTTAAMTDDQTADLDLSLRGSLCRCTGYRRLAMPSAGSAMFSRNPTSASGQGVGSSPGALAGRAIVTGTEEYTLDTHVEGLLHLKVVRSPHAHAVATHIDTSPAEATPGVVAVYTWKDVPDKYFTTAIHEDHLVDPKDTRVLDQVARFKGQAMVAVVAETISAAEAGCRAVVIEWDIKPAVFTAAEAIEPGAPALHHGNPDAFIRHPDKNILLDLEVGPW